MAYTPNDFSTSAVINSTTLFQNYDDEVQQLMTDVRNYLETESDNIYTGLSNDITDSILKYELADAGGIDTMGGTTFYENSYATDSYVVRCSITTAEVLNPDTLELIYSYSFTGTTYIVGYIKNNYLVLELKGKSKIIVYDLTDNTFMYELTKYRDSNFTTNQQVVIVNDKLIFSYTEYDGSKTDQGRLYVHNLSDGTFVKNIENPNVNYNGARFGSSLCEYEGKLYVGASQQYVPDTGLALLAMLGAVFVFDDTTFTLQHTLYCPTYIYSVKFGSTVQVKNNILLVQGDGYAWIFDKNTYELKKVIDSTEGSFDSRNLNVTIANNKVLSYKYLGSSNYELIAYDEDGNIETTLYNFYPLNNFYGNSRYIYGNFNDRTSGVSTYSYSKVRVGNYITTMEELNYANTKSALLNISDNLNVILDGEANLSNMVDVANEMVSYRNEAEIFKTQAETASNSAVSAKEAIESYVIPTTATYSMNDIDSKINALAPYSGYMQVSKKLDNFVFQTSSSFLNKVADKNRFVKFGSKVVDTYGPELVTNGDFSNGTTGWTFEGSVLSVKSGIANITSDGVNRRCQTIINAVSGATYKFKATWIGGDNLGTYRIGTASYGENVIANTPFEYKEGSEVNVTFVSPISGTLYINFYGSTTTSGKYFSIDNISVREIQTAGFTNTVPDVAEVITNGSNTTSVAVSAGDYVLDGSELVTNGTFDTDTSGWSVNYGTISLDTNKLKATGDGTNYTRIYNTIQSNFVVGVEYCLKFDYTSHPNVRIRIFNIGGVDLGYVTVDGASGSKYIKFTATATTGFTFQIDSNVSGEWFTVDNVSVKRVSDTFRAKQTAPIGTSLTNTTYFEDRTSLGVTNQALAYHAYNTLTNAYEGIKTEVLFSDVSKEDLLDNSVWMARNGFSKVSQFLYSKGSYLCLPVGIWQSLNKGAYHPIFNGFGASCVMRDDFAYGRGWNEVTQTRILSIADTFDFAPRYSDGIVMSNDNWGSILPSIYNGLINGVDTDGSGHPQSKYYDICYPDQFHDVREYAKILNRDEVNLIIADKEENGVEEVVYISRYITHNVIALPSGNVEIGIPELYNYGSSGESYLPKLPMYVINNRTNNIFRCDNIQHWSQAELRLVDVVTNTYISVSSNFVLGDSVTIIMNSIDGVFYNAYDSFLKLTKPILSSNTKLSIDLIGNPTNYPQVLKDRLASGVGVVGINPLLVSDTGVNLIPDGTSKIIKASNKVVTLFQPDIQSSNNGVTWTTTNSGIGIVSNAFWYGSVSLASGILRIFSYTSKNNPYIQTTPKPVIEVLPKVKASNSHSIYKGALIGNQVSGKIQVGNGANGYESKVLENLNKPTYDGVIVADDTTINTVILGKRYLIIGGTYNGEIWTRGTNSYTGVFSPTFNYSGYSDEQNTNTKYYLNRGQLLTPTHPTIALDNANSSASKYFKVLEQGNNGVLAGLNGKELAYNSATTSYDGDNELFDQLTNSTKTDLNGKTVRTFHGVIPINGEVK